MEAAGLRISIQLCWNMKGFIVKQRLKFIFSRLTPAYLTQLHFAKKITLLKLALMPSTSLNLHQVGGNAGKFHTRSGFFCLSEAFEQYLILRLNCENQQ